jgi:ATP-dependent Clp protease ATP-binding subunit ClpA
MLLEELSYVRFTHRVRRAINLAGTIANQHHGKIGTDDLLLALLRERDGEDAGVGALALRGSGVSFTRVREAFDRPRLDPEAQVSPVAVESLSVNAGEVLRSAIEEALSHGDSPVDSGHLLLGLVGSENRAGKFLRERFGITRGTARSKVDSIRPRKEKTAPTEK